MGLFDNLKTLVTKGPSGLVQNHMQDNLDWNERYNKADKTDPAVMSALMEEQRLKMNATMDKFGVGKMMPDSIRQQFDNIYNNAGQNSAAMHQVLEAQKLKMAADAQANTPPPLPKE